MAPIFVFFQNFSVPADVPVPTFSFANDLALFAVLAVGNRPVRCTLKQAFQVSLVVNLVIVALLAGGELVSAVS